jgi:hypothetical protein
MNFVYGKLYVFLTLISRKCLKMLNENKLDFSKEGPLNSV